MCFWYLVLPTNSSHQLLYPFPGSFFQVYRPGANSPCPHLCTLLTDECRVVWDLFVPRDVYDIVQYLVPGHFFLLKIGFHRFPLALQASNNSYLGARFTLSKRVTRESAIYVRLRHAIQHLIWRAFCSGNSTWNANALITLNPSSCLHESTLRNHSFLGDSPGRVNVEKVWASSEKSLVALSRLCFQRFWRCSFTRLGATWCFSEAGGALIYLVKY